MAGIQDTNVIDLVTYEPETGEYALIMVETRDWTDTPEQLEQLRDKINAYATFVLNGEFAHLYPETAGKPLRIQLGCTGRPSDTAIRLIALARTRLADCSIRFTVNVLGSGA